MISKVLKVNGSQMITVDLRTSNNDKRPYCIKRFIKVPQDFGLRNSILPSNLSNYERIVP
jgi:hypothetical protein